MSDAAARDDVSRWARALEGPGGWPDHFRRHSKTFSLAARLFPAEERRRVTALYVYCRFTDDLVDEAGTATEQQVRARVTAWAELSRRSFAGHPTGIALLDAVMTDARESGVEWRYPQALLDGVAMDLAPIEFTDVTALFEYTFGVAGAVGGWMTQLLGVHDPVTLDRAHDLGHAMQLTNIVRDVGEDLERGRIYLPRDLMQRHGLTVVALEAARREGLPLPPRYADAMEELMALADARYASARRGLPALPLSARLPVAAALESYRAIHGRVRAAGYDNLRRRAWVPARRRVLLGLRAAWAAAVRPGRLIPTEAL